MSTSESGTMSAKDRDEKRIRDAVTLVQTAWGVSIQDAIPDIGNLRPPNLETPSKRLVKALSAVAGKLPDLVTAQQVMKERRDKRLAQDLTKQGRRIVHITISDLQAIVDENLETAEKERAREVQAAYGLRVTRTPSFKATESAKLLNKRQKLNQAVEEKDVSSMTAEQARVTHGDQQLAVTGTSCNNESTVSFKSLASDQLESSATSADGSKVSGQTTQMEDVPSLTVTSADKSEASKQTAQAEEFLRLPEEVPPMMFAELGERDDIIDLRNYFESSMFCIRSRTAGRIPDERMVMEGAADEMEEKITAALDEYVNVLNLAEGNVDGVFENIMARWE